MSNAVSSDNMRHSKVDMLITKVLTPLIGVSIAMIVVVLVVVIGLVSIVHLRMRYNILHDYSSQ